MRAGWVASFIGHVGAVMMTMLVWEASSTIEPSIGTVVPVEIVDVAPESNVRALAEEVPDEELTPEAAEETTESEPQPAPAPQQRPQRRNQAEDFDPNEIARLLNADSKTGRQTQEGQRADQNRQGAGAGTAELASMEDRARALARAHLRRCWRMPLDLPDPARLVVTVEFDLNRNGTLNGQPRVTNPRNYTYDAPMRTAAEAALRAVRQCDPYPFADDPVIGEHYEIWRTQILRFGPNL